MQQDAAVRVWFETHQFWIWLGVLMLLGSAAGLLRVSAAPGFPQKHPRLWALAALLERCGLNMPKILTLMWTIATTKVIVIFSPLSGVRPPPDVPDFKTLPPPPDLPDAGNDTSPPKDPHA